MTLGRGINRIIATAAAKSRPPGDFRDTASSGEGEEGGKPGQQTLTPKFQTSGDFGVGVVDVASQQNGVQNPAGCCH